ERREPCVEWRGRQVDPTLEHRVEEACERLSVGGASDLPALDRVRREEHRQEPTHARYLHAHSGCGCRLAKPRGELFRELLEALIRGAVQLATRGVPRCLRER